MIKIEDFQKLDIRIGKVVEATEVEGSDKLIRCVVDFGPELGRRIIFSGIKKWYKPEDLIGKLLPYLVNIEPKKMPSFVKTSAGKSEESQGMLIAPAPENKDGEKEAVLLVSEKEIPPGTKII